MRMKSKAPLRTVSAVAVLSLGLLTACGSTTNSVGTGPSVAPKQAAGTASDTGPLTNLAHLNFLLDRVPLPIVEGHTTFNIADEPTAEAPWTYADKLPDGGYSRVGGGDYDAATKTYSQGAYNADDIARTAVVYLKHWALTGDAASKAHAYQTLRSLTYLQTDSGKDAGNVVLWQQADGTLTPSAIPIELPNPSDSAESFWVARTIWALGVGYAAFKDADPAFASFLQQRLKLSLRAIDRQSLFKYDQFDISTGTKVPAWLIVGESDASAEAVLGLTEYVKAAPNEKDAAKALNQLTKGIALVSAGGRNKWPYGAILPQNSAQGVWHAWAGMAPAALADASSVVTDSKVLTAAVKDAAQFTPQLLTAGGADNDWAPTPTGAQIAYGVDSRVQGLVATAKAANAPGLKDVAAMFAGWFFGANLSGQPAYDRATGACVDGIETDGRVNQNSGAESTIQALLTMITLDANPDVKAKALGINKSISFDGLKTVLPPSSPTVLAPGSSVTIPVSTADQDRNVYAVINRTQASAGQTAWTAGATALGSTFNGGAGERGIAEKPGITFPYALAKPLPAAATSLTGKSDGAASVQSLLIQPLISSAAMTGPAGDTAIYVSATAKPVTRPVTVPAGSTLVQQAYSKTGKPVTLTLGAANTVTIAPGGFTIVTYKKA